MKRLGGKHEGRVFIFLFILFNLAGLTNFVKKKQLRIQNRERKVHLEDLSMAR